MKRFLTRQSKVSPTYARSSNKSFDPPAEFTNAENLSPTPKNGENLNGSSPTGSVDTKRKKISDVWKYFNRSVDKKLAVCLTCKKEYKTSGNTSNLRDHLLRAHGNLDENINETGQSSSTSTYNSNSNSNSVSTSASTSARSSVRSVSPYFKRSVIYDNQSQRKNEIDKALALMIALDYQPFAIVNDEGFKNFVHVLDPRYVLPSKTTLRNKFLINSYHSAKEKLQNVLKEVQFVAITSDMWTSCNVQGFLTVTCHFVDKNYQLKTAVLSTKPLEGGPSHTAENIANSLKSILHEWSLYGKVVCAVTDNAANMVKACDILQIRHSPCYAHTLNLVVHDVLQLDCIKQLLLKCKDIVRFFKSSEVASTSLQCEQQNDGHEPLKLIQEVPTRWNSTFYMIRRILKINNAVSRVLLSLKKSPSPLTAEEKTILQDVENILQYFEDATKKISGSEYSTSSLIIPITYGLYCKLSELQRNGLETQEGIAFCDQILGSLVHRLFPYEKRTVQRISTIIDPRFKREGFRSTENTEQASEILEAEISTILRKTKNSNENEAPNDTNAASESTSTSSLSIFSFLHDRLQNKVKSVTVDAIIYKKQYLERSNIAEDKDPLTFWKITENEFPPIAVLAKKYLCIPASSVESERIFSKASYVLSDRRSRLKSKNVDKLIFLNRNKWLL